jgi:hypothetical protein
MAKFASVSVFVTVRLSPVICIAGGIRFVAVFVLILVSVAKFVMASA